MYFLGPFYGSGDPGTSVLSSLWSGLSFGGVSDELDAIPNHSGRELLVILFVVFWSPESGSWLNL